MLLDAKADLLVFGNAERQICEIAHRLAAGETITEITDLRGTAFVRKSHDFIEIDSTHIDTPGTLNPPIDPYAMEPEIRKANEAGRRGRSRRGARRRRKEVVVKFARRVKSEDRERSVIRMPSFETGDQRSRALRARQPHPASREPTPATRARSCSGTAISTCG